MDRQWRFKALKAGSVAISGGRGRGRSTGTSDTMRPGRVPITTMRSARYSASSTSWVTKTVVLVTHDLREATFLADTVYVMSKRPGRIVTTKQIDLPRPRDLDVTYTAPFAAIVAELREHIGALRKH